MIDMKKNFPKLNLSLKLCDDTIMLSELKTDILIKAVTVSVFEAVEKFNYFANLYSIKEQNCK
ncbi:hypothetical protein EB118_19050 [bacterium]|jgi:hypothetical protein|nr:hypothetical protein [Flavobacteriales bacterium]NDG32160.1 hypothetical protein [bacterium]